MDLSHILIVAVGLMIAGAGAAGAILLVRLLSPPKLHDACAAWLNRFSLSRYQVMARLFSEGDFDYLKRQDGYQPEIGRRLRDQRCEVFHAYLKQLKKDYRRLEAVLLVLLASAPQDRPELAKELLHRRLLFQWAVLQARWRMFLFRYGFQQLSVDVNPLLEALSGLRLELGQLALARQSAA